ncbi:MAG: hypothetical protein ACODAQ_08210 [Phycisphaeraceae bacterium]
MRGTCPPNPRAVRRVARAAALLLSVSALLVVVVGCRIGEPRNFSNENDRLRRANLELQREVEQLQDQLQQRLAQIETLQQRAEAETPAPMPGAETPMLSDLAFGRYSGGLDPDDDGVDEQLRLYLKPLDQKGRVLPVAGRARVQAIAIPAEGEPQVIAERTYEPPAFDDAWRSTFTGRHYTLELDLPDDLPADLNEITARVTFTQADTGADFTAQKAFRIRHRQ